MPSDDKAIIRVRETELIKAPDMPALTAAFTSALNAIEQQKPSRQRSLAITLLEESFFHAALSGAGIDSPIRMK